MGELANNVILPAALSYQTKLIENVKGLKELGLSAELYKTQLDIITRISEHINEIRTDVDNMVQERKKANNIENLRDKAIAYDEKVKAYFAPIRYHVDKLEQLVDDSVWPLPKFRELLFI
jgi:glutamine synthetase